MPRYVVDVYLTTRWYTNPKLCSLFQTQPQLRTAGNAFDVNKTMFLSSRASLDSLLHNLYSPNDVYDM